MGQLRAKEDQMLTLGEWWSRRFLQLRQCLSSIEEVGLPPSSRRAVGQSGDPSLVFVSASRRAIGPGCDDLALPAGLRVCVCESSVQLSYFSTRSLCRTVSPHVTCRLTINALASAAWEK